jgi:hypothetical protein
MGAAAAAYLRARHRDIVQLSPAAQAQLELACSRVLTQVCWRRVLAPRTMSGVPSHWPTLGFAGLPYPTPA